MADVKSITAGSSRKKKNVDEWIQNRASVRVWGGCYSAGKILLIKMVSFKTDIQLRRHERRKWNKILKSVEINNK